jgi:hypothetical protein
MALFAFRPAYRPPSLMPATEVLWNCTRAVLKIRSSEIADGFGCYKTCPAMPGLPDAAAERRSGRVF